MSQLQDALAAANAGDKNKAYVMLADLLKGSPDNVDAWVALSDIVDDEKQKRTFLTRALTLDAEHARAKEKLHILDTPPELREPEPAEAEAEPVATSPEPEPEAVQSVEPESVAAAQPAAEAVSDETMMMPPERVEELRLQAGLSPDDTVIDALPVSIDDDFEQQASGETIPPWLMGEDGTILPEAELAAEPEALELPDAAPASEVPDWLQDEVGDFWEEEAAPALPEDELLSTREIAALQEKPMAAAVTKPAAPPATQKLENWFRWLILAFVLVGAAFVYLLYVVVRDFNLLG